MLPPEWTVRVDVLGGTLHVDSDLDGMLTLRGPAVFVARGEALVDI
jgi:diaminopimelate epimerase